MRIERGGGQGFSPPKALVITISHRESGQVVYNFRFFRSFKEVTISHFLVEP